jgi:hypothetical protein
MPSAVRSAAVAFNSRRKPFGGNFFSAGPRTAKEGEALIPSFRAIARRSAPTPTDSFAVASGMAIASCNLHVAHAGALPRYVKDSLRRAALFPTTLPRSACAGRCPRRCPSLTSLRPYPLGLRPRLARLRTNRSHPQLDGAQPISGRPRSRQHLLFPLHYPKPRPRMEKDRHSGFGLPRVGWKAGAVVWIAPPHLSHQKISSWPSSVHTSSTLQ